MSKTRINYDHIIRLMEYRKMLDNLDPKEIEWVRDDGEVISCDERLVKAYRFTGMGNTYFAIDILSGVVKGKEQELLEEFKDLL